MIIKNSPCVSCSSNFSPSFLPFFFFLMNYSDTRLPDFTPFLQRCPPVFFYRYWIVGWLGFFAIKIAEWKRVGLTSFFFFNKNRWIEAYRRFKHAGTRFIRLTRNNSLKISRTFICSFYLFIYFLKCKDPLYFRWKGVEECILILYEI